MTKGTGILNTIFDGYAPYKGDIQYRKQGSLIAFESGESVTYGLFSAQQRGTLFIGPGEKVYGGMVIGQNGKAEDIELNVCKTKHLTNTRSSSADEALTLTPPKILSLEEALEFIDKDELLEVTPKSLRIRKRILDPKLRKREAMKNSLWIILKKQGVPRAVRPVFSQYTRPTAAAASNAATGFYLSLFHSLFHTG